MTPLEDKVPVDKGVPVVVAAARDLGLLAVPGWARHLRMVLIPEAEVADAGPTAYELVPLNSGKR